MKNSLGMVWLVVIRLNGELSHKSKKGYYQSRITAFFLLLVWIKELRTHPLLDNVLLPDVDRDHQPNDNL